MRQPKLSREQAAQRHSMARGDSGHSVDSWGRGGRVAPRHRGHRRADQSLTDSQQTGHTQERALAWIRPVSKRRGLARCREGSPPLLRRPSPPTAFKRRRGAFGRGPFIIWGLRGGTDHTSWKLGSIPGGSRSRGRPGPARAGSGKGSSSE